MKLRLLALGHKLPGWVAEGYAHYARRLPPEFELELVELKPEPRDRGRTVEQMLAAEALRAAPSLRGWHVVALDERGRTADSAAFARQLGQWRDRSLSVVFVIGSADGLADSLKTNADVIMSLSPLTFPHPLARVVLAEQIYRATSLLQGHPYHRE